ncbi:RNA polymerase subunit sigma-70 [Roseovarius sp. SCSIO 43702]|uniref:NepR family anti-sigma factor n=1 Tax=Roseovarius sp. SCSIO 43702 TaxID=2823043 RepID=UPI001C735F24|nr:NepR family anti-sigma factor [Roseovarius sp. SCSIO 43702]QYX57788.1 RNA polymerase subunit sigma-70 [Roseovarius sp. SCSIO 43702]
MTQKRRQQTVLNKQIDENLRRVYSEMAEEPVPDRFTDLLRQLRDKEAGESSGESLAEDRK